jgi:N-carbamoylputrescine amidase
MTHDLESFTVSLIQMSPGKDGDENLARACEKVGEAAKAGGQVICLPELFRSPYFCQHEDASRFDLAEPLDGPSIAKLSASARAHGVSVLASIFERRAAGVYHNSLVVIDDQGERVGVYRKMHIPDDPGYYEKFYFTPGDKGFCAFDTPVGRVGTLVCWDQWYPEAARLTALRGAAVIFYPTAIGWHPAEKAEYGAAQRDAWRTVQRGHAIANGVYVAAVNRVGHEIAQPGDAGIEFWGSSFICDPQGVVLAEADDQKEAILTAEIDLEHLEQIRRNWPFYRDRRIDAYGGITRRFIDDEQGV